MNVIKEDGSIVKGKLRLFEALEMCMKYGIAAKGSKTVFGETPVN